MQSKPRDGKQQRSTSRTANSLQCSLSNSIITGEIISRHFRIRWQCKHRQRAPSRLQLDAVMCSTHRVMILGHHLFFTTNSGLVKCYFFCRKKGSGDIKDHAWYLGIVLCCTTSTLFDKTGRIIWLMCLWCCYFQLTRGKSSCYTQAGVFIQNCHLNVHWSSAFLA